MGRHSRGLDIGVMGHTTSSASGNLSVGIHTCNFHFGRSHHSWRGWEGVESCRTTPSELGHFRFSPFQDFVTVCGAEWLILNY